jgi:hypothetical protein
MRKGEPLPEWMVAAECQWHPDLPWTDDLPPDMSSHQTMNTVCAACPVIVECSRHALDAAQGGFFAGVWLPWNDGGDKNRRVRFRARSALKSRVKC